ncbi:MAG: heme ABC transporter ATP-binding protein [Anaerolineales bacterium]|nr:heme ABC transporter ATP-binding protein [Anaerolineales bacterium]
MLQARDLSVAYGDKTVLHQVGLRLRPGEILGLIGPNGSGKTSLIRALSGVLRPSSGRVLVGKVDLASLPEAQRARQIAVVPQSAELPSSFTVLQCVALGRTPHLNWLGRPGPADEAKVQAALRAAEIEALADRRTGELSGGEKQRVLLARALAQDCPFLLLDEPTAHLDLHHQVGSLELLRRMVAERKLAVLVAMHDLNLASIYADRLMLLVEGRIRAEGAPAAVLTRETLQTAYQVPLQVRANPKHGSPWVVLERS